MGTIGNFFNIPEEVYIEINRKRLWNLCKLGGYNYSTEEVNALFYVHDYDFNSTLEFIQAKHEPSQ